MDAPLDAVFDAPIDAIVDATDEADDAAFESGSDAAVDAGADAASDASVCGPITHTGSQAVTYQLDVAHDGVQANGSAVRPALRAVALRFRRTVVVCARRGRAGLRRQRGDRRPT